MWLVDVFFKFWLKRARYPWSRLRRRVFETGYLNTGLPTANSPEEIRDQLSTVKWCMEGPLHLYDSISYPQTVWAKKKDDCDGFAVLASELLHRWDPTTEPVLLTVMMHPVKESHTVCVFKQDGKLRWFDNSELDHQLYESHLQIVEQVLQRGDRLICWDIADHKNLQQLEFHGVKSL